MVYPHNTFDAETAKAWAWVGEGGMKQYFKVIPKPKPRRRVAQIGGQGNIA